MKPYVWMLLFLVFTSRLTAQLHGANWMVGPTTSILDFRNDTVVVSPISAWMNTTDANAVISDEAGDLLYYTNGIFIADRNGDSVLNGNGISPCPYTTQQAIHGLNVPQAAMFLPMPGDARYYYLFHFSNDTLNDGRPGTLYYSVIDKYGNLGLGEVIDKNHIYYKGVFWGGGMTGCKHANGRDWWIVMHGRNNNTFSTFLLTPNGISDTLTQNIGPNYNGPFDVIRSSFSNDGNKYVVGADVGVITVLDFNRCNGEFSNPITINNCPEPATISGESGVSFSANGRFVYASDRLNLTQYDLWSVNIQDSVEIYRTDSGDFAQMAFLQLAINGKLYCSTWNGGFYFLHVVNKPDEKGDSCGFVFGGQPTLSLNSFNLPNMPNYRLGALVGSGCDTIIDVGLETLDRGRPRIQPNPANKYVYVEMPLHGDFVFELVNETGQLIERKETRQVDIFDTENLPNGVYFLKVTDKKSSSVNYLQKIVVQH